MLQETEREIILELQSGSLVAFEKILFAYENRILNYICRFVGKRADAEDLTQETFLRFYKNIQVINPDNNFKGWLYKIATNVVFDWLRKEKRMMKKIVKTSSLDAEYLIDSAGTDNNRVDAIKEIEDADEVKRAMRQLLPMYQSILILFYWDGWSQPEIARLWNLPLGTVKTKMRQAKKELKNILLALNDASAGGRADEYGLSFRKI